MVIKLIIITMVLVLMANTMMTRVCILFYMPSHTTNLVVDALGFNYLFLRYL